MTVRTTVVGTDALPDLRRGWIDMLPAERWSFFMHPEWCRAVWETYYRRASVRLHLAYQGDELVGLLPVCRRRMNRFGLFLPVAEGFAGGRGDYSMPVVKPGADPSVITALLDSALRASGNAGALVLANVPDETGVSATIERHLRERGLRFRRSAGECPRLLPPPGSTQADTVLSAKRRNDVKRGLKRLQEDVGDVTFRIVTSCSEALDLLPALFEMHDRRWLEAGSPGTFGSAEAREYYRALITNLWDSGIHVSVAMCADKPMSIHLGAVSGGELLYYKPTYDTRLSRYGPGAIHLTFLLQHALDEGLTGIDFLQGNEPYKAKWTNAATTTSTFLIRTSPLIPSYFWLGTGREWAERRIGSAYLKTASWIERRLRRPSSGTMTDSNQVA
jgi:CelD/BcsL family acetyltransferase involved in cellulose biosynthesis